MGEVLIQFLLNTLQLQLSTPDPDFSKMTESKAMPGLLAGDDCWLLN